jgi:hypothetical protein
MKLIAIIAFVIAFIVGGIWLLDKLVIELDPHNDSKMYKPEYSNKRRK